MGKAKGYAEEMAGGPWMKTYRITFHGTTILNATDEAEAIRVFSAAMADGQPKSASVRIVNTNVEELEPETVSWPGEIDTDPATARYPGDRRD